MIYVHARLYAKGIVLCHRQIFVCGNGFSVFHIPEVPFQTVPRYSGEIMCRYEVKQGNASLRILRCGTYNILPLTAVHISKSGFRISTHRGKGDEGLQIALCLVELSVCIGGHPTGIIEHILSGLQIFLIHVRLLREGIGIKQSPLVCLVHELDCSPVVSVGIRQLVAVNGSGIHTGNRQSKSGGLNQSGPLLRSHSKNKEPLSPILSVSKPASQSIRLLSVGRLRLQINHGLHHIQHVLVEVLKLGIARFLIQIPSDVMPTGGYGAVIPGSLAHSPEIKVSVRTVSRHSVSRNHQLSSGIAGCIRCVLLQIGRQV